MSSSFGMADQDCPIIHSKLRGQASYYQQWYFIKTAVSYLPHIHYLYIWLTWFLISLRKASEEHYDGKGTRPFKKNLFKRLVWCILHCNIWLSWQVTLASFTRSILSYKLLNIVARMPRARMGDAIWSCYTPWQGSHGAWTLEV